MKKIKCIPTLTEIVLENRQTLTEFTKTTLNYLEIASIYMAKENKSYCGVHLEDKQVLFLLTLLKELKESI